MRTIILALLFLLLAGQAGLAKSNSVVSNAHNKPRVFFFIVYMDEDKRHNPGHLQSFPYAAKTWEEDIKIKHQFKEGQDVFLERYVRTAQEFMGAWKEIAAIAQDGNYLVESGAVFSHSTLPGEPYSDGSIVMESGLRFHKHSTVTQPMIDVLPKLNWAGDSQLELLGCNAGVMRGAAPFWLAPITDWISSVAPSIVSSEVKWSPASEFAKMQHVKTAGENGYAFFSENEDHYVRISANTKHMYLHAYRRTWNWMQGFDDEQILPAVFKP